MVIDFHASMNNTGISDDDTSQKQFHVTFYFIKSYGNNFSLSYT